MRDHDALAFSQCCGFRYFIELGQRPKRHVVSRRDCLQRIAGMGRYRKPTVPQLDRNAGRNDKAQRLAAFGGRAGRPNLAGQYLLDVRELVEIDVNNFGAVLQVEAGVVTVEAAGWREVTAAQDVGGLVKVDV